MTGEEVGQQTRGIAGSVGIDFPFRVLKEYASSSSSAIHDIFLVVVRFLFVYSIAFRIVVIPSSSRVSSSGGIKWSGIA